MAFSETDPLDEHELEVNEIMRRIKVNGKSAYDHVAHTSVVEQARMAGISPDDVDGFWWRLFSELAQADPLRAPLENTDPAN